MRFNTGCYFIFLALLSCGNPQAPPDAAPYPKDTTARLLRLADSSGFTFIYTGKVNPSELIAFARSLDGVPYKYGSADPAQGFDCSGFVTYVFRHFGIAVPRSSVDFTGVGREIRLQQAKPGDLILFTGTDSTIRTVGHMGILVSFYRDGLKFIHCTSGKSYGVTETPLNTYYMGRYVKTIRIFPQND